jgi:DUF917 family protein
LHAYNPLAYADKCPIINADGAGRLVQAEGGTDVGQIVVSAADESGTELWIYNQNENIFASLNTQGEPYITLLSLSGLKK